MNSILDTIAGLSFLTGIFVGWILTKVRKKKHEIK